MQYKRIRLPSGSTLVMAVDICSSSTITESLMSRGHLKPYIALLGELKHFIAEQQMQDVDVAPYKFTGDGWILLFAQGTKPGTALDFMVAMSQRFADHWPSVSKLLDHGAPTVTGLTFGVDFGLLEKHTIFGEAEYLGRPITIASRLQGSIKNLDGCTGHIYKALVTKVAFEDHLAASNLNVRAVNPVLHGIGHGMPFEARLIDLVPPTPRRVSSAPPPITPLRG